MDLELQNQIIKILDEAGNLLLDYFVQNLEVTSKMDNSPVTNADFAADGLIKAGLKKISDLPIVSEESAKHDNLKAAKHPEFWLLDPLDGTSSFIKKHQDFAICLAKIKNNRPEFGFIHVPFEKRTYFNNNEGAALRRATGQIIPIKVKKQNQALHILSSGRMKNNIEFADYIKKYDTAQISVISSAIKFCKIASGEAQLYPYFGDTMQWDSAAGDAIVHAAGGKVVDLEDNKLFYGAKNDFLNPYFVAKA